MTHAELRSCVDEGEPFTLFVDDGRSFSVPHRDFVWLPPKSTVVMVVSTSPDNPDETVTHTIPLLMVSRVSQMRKQGVS